MRRGSGCGSRTGRSGVAAWRGEREHARGRGRPRSSSTLEPDGSVLPAAAIAHASESAGSASSGRLRRHGRRLSRPYVLERVPRGRYRVRARARRAVAIRSGSQRVDASTARARARCSSTRGSSALDRLFSETGAHAHDGRRLLLRRPVGFELHGVREYEQGESLRRVHWRVNRPPRPADGEGARGRAARRDRRHSRRRRDAPSSGESFDVQVRAAGSILRAYVRRGRRAVLVLQLGGRRASSRCTRSRRTGGARSSCSPRRADESDAPVSASARRAGRPGGAGARARRRHRASRARDSSTGSCSARLPGGKVSLVYVDPTSFNGAQRRPEPLLFRLAARQASPVAIVRAGDDLADALEGALVSEAIRA